MALFLHLAWILQTFLRFGGILAVFAGVALFGVYFIAGNARAGRDGAVPAASWRGAGPRKGMKIFALGAAMLLGAYLVTLLMPSGTH